MRTTLLDILKDAGLVVSTSKGRRLMLEGVVSLNGRQLNRFDDLNITIFPEDAVEIYDMVLFASEYFEKMEKNELPTDPDGPANPR